MIDALKELGLSKNEIKIFLFLLKNGLSSPPEIAKATKISRTNCYNVLNSLLNKDLIGIMKKNSKKCYFSFSPNRLQNLLARKKELLDSIMPNLIDYELKHEAKPIIEYIDNFNELKSFYLQSLESDQIFSIAATNKLMEIDKDFFINFQRKMKEKNIVLHELISSDSEKLGQPQTKAIMMGLLDSVCLPKNVGQFDAEIMIWDDCILIANFDTFIFGTYIKSKQLAQSFKTIFSILKTAINNKVF